MLELETRACLAGIWANVLVSIAQCIFAPLRNAGRRGGVRYCLASASRQQAIKASSNAHSLMICDNIGRKQTSTQVFKRARAEKAVFPHAAPTDGV